MTRIIKNKIFDIILKNRYLLVLNFLIYCFICGITLSEGRLLGLNSLEFSFITLIDHYYILYCVFPIILIIISKHIKEVSDIEKIRYKNTTNLIRYEIVSFMIWLLVYMIIHVLTSLVIGIITMDNSFLFSHTSYHGYNELLLIKNLYSQHFSYPISAIISIVMYFVFGFSILFCILRLTQEKFGTKNMMFLCVALFILTFIGFKTNLSESIPVIFFNNYILLHHGLLVNGSIKFYIVLIVGLLILAKSIDLKTLFRYRTNLLSELTISKQMIKRFYIFIILILGLEIAGMFYEGNFNSRDLFLRMFLGTYDGFSSILGWMKLTILYLTPLYFVGISHAKLNKYRELPIFIRYGSYKKLQWRILQNYTKFILGYSGIIVMFMNLSFLNGQDSEFIAYILENFNVRITPVIAICYLLTFTLNLMLLFILFLLLIRKLNSVISFVLMVFMFFTTYLIPQTNILSLGLLNYINFLKENNIILILTTILKLIIILLYYYILKRRSYGNHKIK